MKVNLELEEEDYDTSFSFTIDEEYEQKVIGADLHGGVKSYPSSGQINNEKEEVTCSVGEELGADKVTCVCKYGYERVNGVCTEKTDNNSGNSGSTTDPSDDPENNPSTGGNGENNENNPGTGNNESGESNNDPVTPSTD